MEGSKNSHSVEEDNIGEKNTLGNIIKGSEIECNPPENKAKLKKLCRLCARTDKEMIYIFNNDGSKHNLAYKINACLPIQVKKTDPLPKQLCTTCIEQLNTTFEFSECCVEAEDKLNSRMDRNLFQ